MAHLDVDPANLLRAAGDYTELLLRAAAVGHSYTKSDYIAENGRLDQ
jgi:hypothetical protein